MKKILFVIRTLRNGGAERGMSDITQAFPDDWEIDILVNDEKVVDFPYRGRIISMGLVNTLAHKDFLPWVFWEILRRARVLRKLKKENQYAACISYLDSSNISNILSGNKYCKTFIAVHSSLSPIGKPPWYKYIISMIVNLLYSKADKIITVSRGIALELKNNFKVKEEQICVIENGYPIENIVRLSKDFLAEEEKELFENKMVLMAVGRLTYQKAFWHLIRAFSLVCKAVGNARLIILGEGEQRDYLLELIRRYGLEGKAVLKGFVGNPYKYVARADIFVMSSMFEGFPNAMAEAMCLGVPCIATDFRTGARELLEPALIEDERPIEDIRYGEYGVITPLCSGKKYYEEELEPAEQMLSKALEILCTDEAKRKHYAAQSRKRSKGLGIEEAVRKWISVIEE